LSGGFIFRLGIVFRLGGWQSRPNIGHKAPSEVWANKRFKQPDKLGDEYLTGMSLVIGKVAKTK